MPRATTAKKPVRRPSYSPKKVIMDSPLKTEFPHMFTIMMFMIMLMMVLMMVILIKK